MLNCRCAVLAVLAGMVIHLWGSDAFCTTRNFDIGDRLSAFSLMMHDGSEELLQFDRPTVVILWATWSPASVTALSELLRGAPQGGIRWQLLPVNVDAPSLNSSDTARINSAARSAGWNGAVLCDRGYSLMDHWGVLAVPTVAITGMGGIIDELEHDWSPVLRDRLFTLYFGAITDSFPGMTEPVATAECRAGAAAARQRWRLRQSGEAIESMRKIVDECDGLPIDVARYVHWACSEVGTAPSRVELDRVLERQPQNAWTLVARGTLEVREGSCSTAVEYCRIAATADSAFLPAWIQLAECLWKMHDTAGAAKALERARLLNRFDARVLALGANLAEARGEFPEAARLYRAAVEARMRHRHK
jgi:hypothetical protein